MTNYIQDKNSKGKLYKLLFFLFEKHSNHYTLTFNNGKHVQEDGRVYMDLTPTLGDRKAIYNRLSAQGKKYQKQIQK